MPVAKYLDTAQNAKSRSAYHKACGQALTRMIRDAARDGEPVPKATKSLAQRFARICMKSGRTGVGAYEGALPAGGEVFEAVGTDLAKKTSKKKPRRKKNTRKGYGKHCVYSKDKKLVRCFERAETAQRVARGFGSGFRVAKGRG